MEFNTIFERITDLQNRVETLKNSANYTRKIERLNQIAHDIKKLERERQVLEKFVQPVNPFEKELLEQRELLELAYEVADHETTEVVCQEVKRLEQQFSSLDINLFFDEIDVRHAFLEIQPTGGTGLEAEAEAQDCAILLLGMYLRWSERNGFTTNIIHYSPGDITGFKSVALHVSGENAYGWLRTETGKHRLIRRSPFESTKRNCTSFVEISVVPEADKEEEIEIDPAELRIDLYRTSGAGGPHVNRHESGVRITHLPTNIVVQCNDQRSSHQNKAIAFRHLQAKLVDFKRQQCQVSVQSSLENNQQSRSPPIRSYMLDKSYIEDFRTGLKTEDVEAVLDGNLDNFMKACLKSGL